MKKKSFITILSLILGLSMATTSCEDMLSSDSNRHSYEVAGDTLYSYWGIIQSLQHIGERYVILGECRGDLIDGGEFTWWDNGSWRFLPPVIAGFKGGVTFPTDQAKVVDPCGVESLFESQLTDRLGTLPDWLEKLK